MILLTPECVKLPQTRVEQTRAPVLSRFRSRRSGRAIALAATRPTPGSARRVLRKQMICKQKMSHAKNRPAPRKNCAASRFNHDA